MSKIANKVIKFTEETMEKWREGGKSLAEVKIQRTIFQRDELSPLQFVIVMMPLNHIGNAQVDTNLINHKKNQTPNEHGWHQTVCQKMEKN